MRIRDERDPGGIAHVSILLDAMGGPGAPDDLNQGHRTQVWLALSEQPAAKVTGQYFYHLKLRSPHRSTRDEDRQEKLLEACKRASGIALH